MDLLNVGPKTKKNSFAVTQDDLEKVASSVVTKMQTENKSFKEVLGVNDSFLEQIYSLARGHYEQGNYKEALSLFYVLTFSDPTNFDYAFGYASTCHQMKDFNKALLAFTIALGLETKESPEIVYYIADCLLHLNMPKEADEALVVVIERCQNKREYHVMKEEALILRNAIMLKK